MTGSTTRSHRITEDRLGESFEMFYRREYAHMVAIARALSPDRATAEDLAQDSFVTAHKHWDRVGAYDDPQAWVRRVMINRATSLRRRVKAEVRALARAGHEPERGETADLTPATSEVWDEVQRLPRRQQQALVLHYVGQLSTQEIGDALGCSQGAVKTHLHRARETLRAQLHQWRDDEHG